MLLRVWGRADGRHEGTLTMEGLPNLAEQLRQFLTEVDGSMWHATMDIMLGGVCLRIEQRNVDEAHAARPAIEICRATLAQAVESARKHITPQRVG